MLILKKIKRPLIWIPIALIAVASTHISWIEDDLGVLLTVADSPFDLIGTLRNQMNKATRNCESVVRLTPSQDKYQMAQSLVHSYSPPDSKFSQLVSVWSLGSWVLVEVEFKDLLPAVVLIKDTDKVASIVPEGIWSGYTNPHKSASFIRKYLIQKVDSAPVELINCFDPQSQSFR